MDGGGFFGSTAKPQSSFKNTFACHTKLTSDGLPSISHSTIAFVLFGLFSAGTATEKYCHNATLNVIENQKLNRQNANHHMN